MGQSESPDGPSAFLFQGETGYPGLPGCKGSPGFDVSRILSLTFRDPVLRSELGLPSSLDALRSPGGRPACSPSVPASGVCMSSPRAACRRPRTDPSNFSPGRSRTPGAQG